MIFGDFPINFRITYGKYCINFLRIFFMFLKSAGRSSRAILMKFWRHLRETEKKILNNSREIMESLLEKN